MNRRCRDLRVWVCVLFLCVCVCVFTGEIFTEEILLENFY